MALGQFLNRGRPAGHHEDEATAPAPDGAGRPPHGTAAPEAAPAATRAFRPIERSGDSVTALRPRETAAAAEAERPQRSAKSLGQLFKRVAARERLLAEAAAQDSLPQRLGPLGGGPAGAGAEATGAVRMLPQAAPPAEAAAPDGGLRRRRAGTDRPPTPPVPPATARRPATPPPEAWSARLPLGVGIFALILLVGGLGAWSFGTTLSGAVVAPGMVEVESNRQVIQHPDGGVVRAINVRDGDRVAPGEVLVELDGTRLASQLAIVEGQLGELSARQARLIAERDGDTEIAFPADLMALAAGDPVIAEKLEGERALFTARVDALDLQTGLVAEQNRQIDNRIRGIEAQLEAARTQLGLLESQLADRERLLDQGLTQAEQVLDLQREQAELRGRIGQFEAEIAGLRGEAAGNGITLLQVQTQRREEAVTVLRDLEYSRIELAERRLDLIETLSRLEVRAPVEGIVYNSQVFAVQSVVQAAQPLMYIVPQDQPLVITARVNATNIDEIYIGQPVSLRLAAFDQRLVPELEGVIQRVSADVIRDENTGESYYEAAIVPGPGELDKLGDRPLVPGMPVDALIRTRDRAAITYLTEPFTAFFARAFRE